MGRWIKGKDGVLTYSPYRLKFYETEIDGLFSDVYAENLSRDETELIFNKLKRHYKVGCKLVLDSRIKGGYARGGCLVVIGKNPSVGLVAHEVSHVLDRRKRMMSKHDKKFLSVLKRVMAYCRKKDFWRAERARRKKEIVLRAERFSLMVQKKQVEMKSTSFKLEKVVEAKKRWESKLRRAENALKKLGRREKLYKMLIAKQESVSDGF